MYLFYLEVNYFTIVYWFCHTSIWIRNRYTCVPHPEPPSHLCPCTIPLGHPSAPAPSILYPALNLDWQFVSYMILYTFQCHSPKSSHPLPLPQSPKDGSIHLCLFKDLFSHISGVLKWNSQTTNGINPATGLEKVSLHSNPKERKCQRMLKLPHKCTHLTC